MEKKPLYEIDKNDCFRFKIKNYNLAKPFTGFFPGIAGIMGIPVWCFYVNRGQCISSFGFDTKDGAIMEFQPANKAYRYTPLYGFRTFLKLNGQFYEPFRETNSNRIFNIENIMEITSYDLTIKEENKTLGIEIEINYFTIPNEPIGALARMLTIKNNSEKEIDVEILDGIPQIMPYGLTEFAMKNMSRTIEAWYTVDIENNLSFYRIKTTFQDIAEVKPVTAGHFYFAFVENENLLPSIIDPSLIFGVASDLTYPFKFMENNFKFPEKQHFVSRTPSAFTFAGRKMKKGETITLYSLSGKAENLEKIKKLSKIYSKKEFFIQKAKENETLIKTLMDNCFVVSSKKEFDIYSRNSFLDNLLRGGFPYTIKSDHKTDVLYLFSRKHGDPERDYNNFKLQPTYFSQGNGSYRDVNQNRRNDIFFNPEVGYSNILYFINLIQLDGYNPLTVKGISYVFDKNEKDKLNKYVENKEIEKIFEKNFTPSDIINFVMEKNISFKKGNLFDFISVILTNSKKIEEAEFGEGYWSDHWFYNLDLIESFEAIFPDKMKFLLTELKEFSYFDTEVFVLPRSERYVLNYNNEPRQYRSLIKDKEKINLIKSREVEPNKVRVNNGKGEIYKTDLISKLITLAVIKLSTLDPENIGIEMEAGKPGWNDSLNGLPGLFGSSLNETMELKRLFLMLKRWILEIGLEKAEISLPIEIFDFFKAITNILSENIKKKISNFEFWDLCSTERETYRERIKFGIDGREIKVKLSKVMNFIEKGLKKLNDSIERAYDEGTGLYTTYFYYNLVKYKIENNKIIPLKFEIKRIAHFLEGAVHFFRIENEMKKLRKLAFAVRESNIYDKKLKMYKIGGSLENEPLELGRVRAFPAGWLENESVFSHMEYKYLLELLKSGLYDIFYEDMKNCLVPFLNPEVYGRSIFENVSFIVSSTNPDPELHGIGFYPRLSGTTSEFYHMLLVMAFGKKPFFLNENGNLCLEFKPAIASWLFTEKDEYVDYHTTDGAEKIFIPKNSFAMSFMNSIVIFKNPTRKDTFHPEIRVLGYILFDKNGKPFKISGSVIGEPYSVMVRKGRYKIIDVLIG